MTRPNLFLVGAAKSGTTSMATYLGEHPQVFMAQRAEMHHFGRDLTIKYRVGDRAEYLATYSETSNEIAAGEKSVGYLFSRTAADEIFEFRPDAHILIMLRNPVDMIFSLHRQFLRSGNEDIVDFRQALDAQSDRKAGRRIPPTAHKPDMLQYLDVGSYSSQVERYLNRFDGRVAIVLFDDLKRDPSREYRRVLEMLGADTTFQPNFVIHNPTIDLPSIALRRQMVRRPRAASLARGLVTPRIRRKLRRASAIFQKQPPRTLGAELRRELVEYFTPDVVRLTDLIQRDLSAWVPRESS